MGPYAVDYHTGATREAKKMVVVDGVSGYVPLYRIDRADIAEQHGGRGGGESAVPGRDENHVTMASEAATTAVDRSAVGVSDLGAVFVASVSDYYAEHGIAAQLAYRLGATGDVRTADFQGTGRAAADAVAVAVEYVESTGQPTLVAAADIMPAEPGGDDEGFVGAGAGAVVLSPAGTADATAATIEGLGQATTGFVERHREHGSPTQTGDDSFERSHGITPAVTAALDRLGRDAAEYAVASAPGYRQEQTALGPIEAEPVSTFNEVGYAGTATLLLDVAHAIESADADDDVLAVAYGQGGADVLALTVAEGVDETVGLTVAEQIDAKEYVPYTKHLTYRENYDYQGVPNP